MTTLTGETDPQIVTAQIDFRRLAFPSLQISTISRSPTQIQYVIQGNLSFFTIGGTALDTEQGVVTSFSHSHILDRLDGPKTDYRFTDFSAPASSFLAAYELGDPLAVTLLVLGGDDSLTGVGGDDYLWGLGGNDSILGASGDDTLGGDEGRDWVRGGDGSDVIHGGAEFDDLHGNMGNDTVVGAGGDDWVVGGKDNDLLMGDAGADIAYGNLGDDTAEGGEGADIVRGGQGDDIVRGGSGDDWLSGDLGKDTISGDAGADIFHTFLEAGQDVVTDFSVADGDRVQVAPGASWSARSSTNGQDTVVELGDGSSLLLVGVPVSTLPAGWIFEG